MRWALSGTNWEGRRWSLAASLTTLAKQIDAKQPKGHGADGTVASRTHDQNNPSSDHRPTPYTGTGKVRALDCGETVENQAFNIAEAIRKSKDKRVKYVIHEGRMYSSYPSGDIPPFTWRAYKGPNPHSDHFHISTLSQHDSVTTPWSIGTVTQPPGGITLTITRSQIKKGSKTSLGGDVALCQGLLHGWGFGITVGKVDGIFGDNTDKAVRAFQKARKLTVDGVVGATTWKALES